MGVVLSCRGVGKTYGVHPLFEDLTIGIDAGFRVGIVGPNGSGKSTLLRILAGLETADEGERSVAHDATLATMAQSESFPPDLEPLTAVMEALTRSHPQWDEHQHRTQAIMMLDRSGFGRPGNPLPDQPIGTLSGGWHKRLSIIRALAQEASVLILDEPTNHLDIEGIWWLEQVLIQHPGTVVLVSHDRFFIERVCTRVIEINRLYPGGMFSSMGGYGAFLERRAAHVANQLRQQDALDNKVRREIAWLRANPSAQTVKSKARVDRAGDLVAELSALRMRNSQDRAAAIGFTSTGRVANAFVTLTGVGAAVSDRQLFSDVSVSLGPGDRLGILGLNGSGKTTLLRILAGQRPPEQGVVVHAPNLRIVHFDQQRRLLDPAQSLRRALCPTGDTVIVRGRGVHVSAWAKRFLFQASQLDVVVGALSGGEQARVLIASLVRQEADVLILDEPTNDLDIPTLEVLEESLREFPGAVALVTHDRYVLDRVCTGLVALDGRGGAWAVQDCGQWEDLAERLQSQWGRTMVAPARAPASAVAQTPGSGTARLAQRGLSGRERRELASIESRIAEGEARVETLNRRISEPAVAGDAEALARLCTELAEAEAAVAGFYERWQRLEAKSSGS